MRHHQYSLSDASFVQQHDALVKGRVWSQLKPYTSGPDYSNEWSRLKPFTSGPDWFNESQKVTVIFCRAFQWAGIYAISAYLQLVGAVSLVTESRSEMSWPIL